MRARLLKRQKLTLEEGVSEPSFSPVTDQGAGFSTASLLLSTPFITTAGKAPLSPSGPPTGLTSGSGGISSSLSSPSPNLTATLVTWPTDDTRLVTMDASSSPPSSPQRPSSEPLGASPTVAPPTYERAHSHMLTSPLTSPFSFEVDLPSDADNTFPLASGPASPPPAPTLPEPNVPSSLPSPEAARALPSPSTLSSQMGGVSPPPEASSLVPLPPPFAASAFPEELGSSLESMERTLQLVPMIIILLF